LKQASRQWNSEFCKHLQLFGFTQSAHDNCLFILHSDQAITILLVYVDDVLITGTDDKEIQKVKDFLDTTFTIKDLGLAKYFLGIEIARCPEGLYLNQRKYAMDIVNDAGLIGSKLVDIPLPKGHKFTAEGVSYHQPDQYKRLVGRLLYLNLTRPDLSYAVQQLSQFVNSPTVSHWESALHLLKYIKGTLSKGLFFP